MEIEIPEHDRVYEAQPVKKLTWLTTKELRWKTVPVAQLSAKLNAPRMDKKLQQKWICEVSDRIKYEWRDVPLVSAEEPDKI